MAYLSQLDLLNLIVSLQSRSLIRTASGVTGPGGQAIIGQTIKFVNGDTVRGTIYAVSETGTTATPYVRAEVNCDIVRLSDGLSVIYAAATHVEKLNDLGLSPPSHIAFTLDVTSAALTTALNAESGDFITAFFEARIQIPPLNEGTPGITTQDIIVLREPCQIYKTSIP